MVHRFLRQKFSSAGVVVALAALALVSAPQIAASGGRSGFEAGTLALLILAAGCVAKDASGGALQMILCRPILRSDYLLGRYLGILAGFGAFLIGASVLGVVFARAIIPALGSPSQPVAFDALGRSLAATFLGGVASAATILLLSTFLPGYGDVLGFILLTPLAALPDLAGQILRAPWLQKAGQTLRENLLPSLDWSAVLQGRNPLGEATGRWTLAVVVYLVAALAIFSRREFAYGQD
jgi:ABC-type transport system involved in multi-copper enzyme maturation permease subunit